MLATIIWGFLGLAMLWLWENGGGYMRHMSGCLISLFLVFGVFLGLLLHDLLLNL
jgi:hypothetical protein